MRNNNRGEKGGKMTTAEFWEEIERIETILGKEQFLDELEKAMGTDELENLTAYICRANDIETELVERD